MPYSQRLPLTGVGTSQPTGHYYSPVCDPDELAARREELWPAEPPECLGIDFDDESHRQILQQWFPRFIADFDYPEHGNEDHELNSYYTQNSQFSWLDARTLFVMLRALRPKRVIEVGSGYSSLLMADVNQRFLDGAVDIRCIEPYPRDFLKRGMAGISEVIVKRVQDVPLTEFAALAANDILFIDSSHVAKTGSDVNYLFFEVLPRLQPGVIVHVHDIFLPAEYLESWAIDLNRSWNEQYLLRALLMHSTAFKPMFGCSYAWLRHPDLVAAALALPGGAGFGGGSFWIRRL
ncbi:MAG: class I SAM-dependent methyltransferase [Lysobacterales bacterium]